MYRSGVTPIDRGRAVYWNHLLMRLGVATLLLCGWLLACQAAPQPVPDGRPKPAEKPVVRETPKEAVIPERDATAVLRTHLLQLLPCDRRDEEAEVDLTVEIGADGGLKEVAVEGSNASKDTTQCLLAQVSLWRFPEGVKGRLRLSIQLPLAPPSLFDHAAVQLPSSRRIDLQAVERELRRLRKKFIGCYPQREEGARLFLLSLRLSESGKVLDAHLAADTQRGEVGKDCLRKVLKSAKFSPVPAPVEVRYPIVSAK